MRRWLTDKVRADFAEIYDCEPHEVDARLDAQEGITATVAVGAANLRDAVRDQHWSKPVTSPSRLDAIALAKGGGVMAKVIDTRDTPVAVNDAARPFAVLVGSKLVGRYETKAQAARRARS